jgi:hypothetical protein
VCCAVGGTGAATGATCVAVVVTGAAAAAAVLETVPATGCATAATLCTGCAVVTDCTALVAACDVVATDVAAGVATLVTACAAAAALGWVGDVACCTAEVTVWVGCVTPSSGPASATPGAAAHAAAVSPKESRRRANDPLPQRTLRSLPRHRDPNADASLTSEKNPQNAAASTTGIRRRSSPDRRSTLRR